MKRLFTWYSVVIVLFIFVSGCAALQATRHQYIMRGHILESKDNIVYLCIGSSDGAKTGQELTVYKFEKVHGAVAKQSTRPHYNRKEAGRIKITEIVDEHMAKAIILTGEAGVNFVVELK